MRKEREGVSRVQGEVEKRLSVGKEKGMIRIEIQMDVRLSAKHEFTESKHYRARARHFRWKPRERGEKEVFFICKHLFYLQLDILSLVVKTVRENLQQVGTRLEVRPELAQHPDRRGL